jgi:hypothetical protein
MEIVIHTGTLKNLGPNWWMVEHKGISYNVSSGSMEMIELGTLKDGDDVQFWIINSPAETKSIMPDWVCLRCPHCHNYGDAGKHPHIQNKHILQFNNEMIDLSHPAWARLEVLDDKGVVIPNVVCLNTKTLMATLRGVTEGGMIGTWEKQLENITFRLR